MDTNAQNVLSDDQKDKVEKTIFDAIGAGDIPEEEKGALLAKMMELIESRVITKVYDSLSEDKRKEMEKASEADDPRVLEQFLTNEFPNLEKMYTDEAERLKLELNLSGKE